MACKEEKINIFKYLKKIFNKILKKLRNTLDSFYIKEF